VFFLSFDYRGEGHGYTFCTNGRTSLLASLKYQDAGWVYGLDLQLWKCVQNSTLKWTPTATTWIGFLIAMASDE
jgi:hypothetical protein